MEYRVQKPKVNGDYSTVKILTDLEQAKALALATPRSRLQSRGGDCKWKNVTGWRPT